MFENLSDRLERSFKILKGEGKITEINVAETLTIHGYGETEGDGYECAHCRETESVDGEDRTRRTRRADGWQGCRTESRGSSWCTCHHLDVWSAGFW